MDTLLQLGENAEQDAIVRDIQRLKKDKDALMLVHNYQLPEIHRIADITGDSYWLSKKAAEATQRLIVFNGVLFMAETAKILNPAKKVIIPTPRAGCTLAQSIDAASLLDLRLRHPDAGCVVYINTYADVKAVADAVCTSANAIEIMEAMPQEKVIFAPDRNMGEWLQKELRKRGSKKELILWDGYCEPHRLIRAVHVLEAKARYPGYRVICHPECNPEVIELADYTSGTSQMVKDAADDPAPGFILATEKNMTFQMEKLVPHKKFVTIGFECNYMNMNRIGKVKQALESETYEIRLPQHVIDGARKALEFMLTVGPGNTAVYRKCLSCS